MHVCVTYSSLYLLNKWMHKKIRIFSKEIYLLHVSLLKYLSQRS